MAWLHDILNNQLVDNQEYFVENRILNSSRLGKIELASGHNRKRKDRKTDEIWHFLSNHCSSINDRIKNKKDNLFLINDKEYEHNSDDPLIKVIGSNGENFYLKTGNVIGFIKNGPLSLKISSRFGDDFLKYIISDADGFLKIDESGGIANENGFDWLLSFLWISKLKKAFRIGLPKSYENINEKIPTVKGRLNVLKYYQNTQSGKYHCTYREHSYDNEANRLIVSVFKKLQENDFVKHETTIKSSFFAATKGAKLNYNQINKVKTFSNPFYSEYNYVIHLSKLILRNKGLDFGNSLTSDSFLFDVSMLFEYFIRKLLIRNGFSLEDKFQNSAKIPAGRPNKYKRSLQPDIVITSRKKAFVFDVKYKSFDWYKYGVDRNDLFQIHTYYGQISNKYEVPACGFIYPVSQKNWENNDLESRKGILKEELMIGGKKTHFYTIFLKVPDRLSCIDQFTDKTVGCRHEDEELINCQKKTSIIWKQDFYNSCLRFTKNLEKMVNL